MRSAEAWNVLKNRLLALVLFGLAPASTLAQLPLGPSGPNSTAWTVAAGGNGHVYEPVLTQAPVTWAMAHAAALAAGGHLATITSAAENAFCFSLIDVPVFWTPHGTCCNCGPWLGGMQPVGTAEPLAGWSWITGESFAAFNAWASGQPDDWLGEQDHLLFWAAGGPNNRAPTWDDGYGPGLLISYLVEYEPSLACSCTPTGLGASVAGPAATCGAFNLCVARDGAGAIRLQVFNLPSGAFLGKTLISTVPAPAGMLGQGPTLGLYDSSLLAAILALPFGPGDLLSWTVSEPGVFPRSLFLFPPGTAAIFAGSTWDMAAGVLVSGPTGLSVAISSYVQIAW